MPNFPAYPLQIFYDGSCSVCTAKMAVYQGKEHDGRLLFIDVSSLDFDPAPYGISLEAFLYELHAIDGNKRVYRGVNALRAIWQAFPGSSFYGLLVALITCPGINQLAQLAYWSFARMRRFLPQSHARCSKGHCGIGSDKLLR
jgi:predicted DCC family thiol-disulfide oxidoreductase YuxK